jgi:hypothetical protein
MNHPSDLFESPEDDDGLEVHNGSEILGKEKGVDDDPNADWMRRVFGGGSTDHEQTHVIC